MNSQRPQVNGPSSWEPPTVSDLDVAARTLGGGSVFSDETTYNCCTPYAFSGDPSS